MKEGNIDNFLQLKFLDKYMLGHSGFIAGGCFKNIFNKERIKDIDIFFESYSDFIKGCEYFDTMTHGYERDDKRYEKYWFLYENDNVKAYKEQKTGIVLELNQKIFGTPEEILNQFDFTICKFAYYKSYNKDSHVDAYKILYTDDYFEHIFMKRLVVDDKIPYPMSTFERMIKYIKYGYMPCRETKLKIAKAINEISKEEVVANKSLYNGID